MGSEMCIRDREKPEGVTSFEIVKRVRKATGIKKVGHTGTLDKFASGLLLVCVGRATVLQQLFMEYDKTYIAALMLGKETETLDPYGKVVEECKVGRYSDEEIKRVLSEFTGKITQIPPSFSAIHHKGERLYKLALQGKKILPEPRKVEVKNIKLIENKTPEIIFEATVSKGTYIRALARDIARKLGTCGYLISLKRLRIGNFMVENALGYNLIDEISVRESIIPINEALKEMPCLEVSSERIRSVINGVPLDDIADVGQLSNIPEGFFRIVFRDTLIAVGIKEGKKCSYFRVIVTDPLQVIKENQ